MKQIWNKKSGGATLSKFDYVYDAEGRIREWTQQADAATPQVMTLDYDGEDQLLNAVVGPAGGSATRANAYRYDGMGNRLSEQKDVFTPSQNSTVTSGTFNTVNQLTGQNPAGPVPVQFKGKVNEAATVTVNGQSAAVTPDAGSATGGRTFSATLSLAAGNNTVSVVAEDFGAGTPPGANHGGNVTTKNYSVTVATGTAKTLTYDNNGNCTANGSVTYEWDAEDRLVAINNGALRSEFTYDGFGRRVRIMEKNNGAPTSTKQFVWVGLQIAEERDGANAVTKRFYAEGAIHYQPSTINYFYTRDHLGSVREVTDNSGNVLARYDYDPYGKLTLVSGSPISDFCFTGHYYHAPSGLHLAVYRAYDAELGRWLNRDPIAEAGGINLYGYVGNEPVNYFDPLGLMQWDKFWSGAAKIAVSAIGIAILSAAEIGTGGLATAGVVVAGMSLGLSFSAGIAEFIASFKDDLPVEVEDGLERLPCNTFELIGAPFGEHVQDTMGGIEDVLSLWNASRAMDRLTQQVIKTGITADGTMETLVLVKSGFEVSVTIVEENTPD